MKRIFASIVILATASVAVAQDVQVWLDESGQFIVDAPDGVEAPALVFESTGGYLVPLPPGGFVVPAGPFDVGFPNDSNMVAMSNWGLSTTVRIEGQFVTGVCYATSAEEACWDVRVYFLDECGQEIELPLYLGSPDELP